MFLSALSLAVCRGRRILIYIFFVTRFVFTYKHVTVCLSATSDVHQLFSFVRILTCLPLSYMLIFLCMTRKCVSVLRQFWPTGYPVDLEHQIYIWTWFESCKDDLILTSCSTAKALGHLAAPSGAGGSYSLVWEGGNGMIGKLRVVIDHSPIA